MNNKQIKDLLSAARTEIKEGKWDQAFETLSPLQDAGLENLPKAAFSLLILSSAMTKQFRLGQELVKSAPRSILEDLNYLKAAAELFFTMEEYRHSLVYFESIHRNFEGKISGKVAKMYARALKEVDRADAIRSKGRSIGKISQSADYAYSALRRRNYDEAIDLFRETVALLPVGNVEKHNWIEAFTQICDAHGGLTRHRSMGCKEFSLGSDEPVRALSVSGMGWSGSGAIFDYFSEFQEIDRISGEFPVIQSKTGIQGLYAADVAYEALERFFKFNLFGFCGKDADSHQKNVRYSKSLTVGKRAPEYAAAANTIVSNLKCALSRESGTFPLKNLRQVTDIYLRFRASLHSKDSFRLPMFDNIIHAYNLDALRFIPNMSVFCSIRDPRSNYVAIKRENLSFDGDVSAFVGSYRKKRMSIRTKYEIFTSEKYGDGYINSDVHFVQFENFVLDAEYRRDLARKAGLNIVDHDEFAHFKPWKSEKNVFLFENYENQDEIRYIEKELPEYCIDLNAFDSVRTKS